jgi:hypothetical protein
MNVTFQTKLTKDEWNSIEIPVQADEMRILSFIKQGFQNPELVENQMQSLYTYLKVDPSPELDIYLCNTYFSIQKVDVKVKLKKADQIRVSSFTKKISVVLYEHILIELCDKKEYFQLHWMVKLNVSRKNKYVMQYATRCLETCTPDIREMTWNAVELLEKNKYVKYRDTVLYEHQKQLFTISKQDGPKLILYVAPTGTGKTVSPIGLSEKYKVIFVCAAKHVGMALMKACVSLGKPCAVAFGCKDQIDIRLHNSAAVDCIRDRRSGAIRKVDNANGSKVEIIISDIQSYLHAMEYMLKFNSVETLLKYWDEPTITMDEETHPLHEIISKNWRENKIPTIVLSSATLPKIDYTLLTKSPVYKIYTYESNKTIQVISPDNHIVLPHHYCKTKDELMCCIEHIEQNLILLKYIDLGAVLSFLKEVPFTKMEDITITAIKMHYLTVLKTDFIVDERIQVPSTIKLCSDDAWTCSYGPTIYVANDVRKIASYCLKTAAIPENIFNELMKNLAYNNLIAEKMGKLEKDMADKNKDDEKEKKMADNRVNEDVKRIQTEITQLQSSIKPITLPDVFIPNKYDHLKRYGKLDKLSIAFTSDMETSILEKILSVEVDTAWKVLIMMGIAVFSTDVPPKYLEIVKELTAKQKLYAIFATTDFIFGTNYQFANLYVGKDLAGKLTQEKLIQTAGRVGRGAQVPYSIRLRDESFIHTLFMPQTNHEGITMQRLFR